MENIDTLCFMTTPQQNLDQHIQELLNKVKEDGNIDLKYPLTETKTEQYVARTRQNVIDSDGTLVIYFGTLEGGTARTIEFCKELKKPCLQLDGSHYNPQQAADRVMQYVAEHHIHTLNVAGPRASKQPNAHAYTLDVISHVLTS